MENTRTIQTILSLDTGEQLEVNELFKEQTKREAEIFQLRTKIEIQIQTQEIEYVCIFCKQPIALRGRSDINDKSKHFYFTHLYRSNDCVIKTQNRLTEEQVRCVKYNGEKESLLHDKLKNLIGSYLKSTSDVYEVNIEQVYRDKAISMEWRKPDVMATYQNKKIAFELQLSTTFLSVIVARTLFYRNRDVYLMWIFPHFSIVNDLQKFTQKDVYYNNNFNVYVFDEQAQKKSKEANELILKCFYKEHYIIHESIFDKWTTAYIKMAELKFDTFNTNLWFYNSESEKNKLEKQISQLKYQRNLREEEEKLRIKVDSIAVYLKEFYKDDIKPVRENIPLENIKTEKEVQALSNKLKFTNENVSFITKLFFERKKPFFLKYVFENDNILIDTSKLINNNRTVFQEILTVENRSYYKVLFSFLFRKGYILTEEDKQSVNIIYQKNYFNTTEHEKEMIERWAYSVIFSSVKSKEISFDILNIQTPLMAIMSLKYDLIIGYHFKNLREVTHNFLIYHKEYGVMYLKAMKAFGQYDKQLEQDKTGKLKLKIQNFVLDNPIQETKYNRIFNEVFPELINL